MLLSPQTAQRLEYGRGLFNAGHYFEAHEVWEDAWREELGTVRLLLHGLIQVAAGYHKATRQNQPKGCVRLLEVGLTKLEGIPDGFLGLALARFKTSAEESLEEARRWREGKRPGLDRRFLAVLEVAATDSEGKR